MRRRPAPALATPPSNKTQSTGSCAPARGRGPAPAQDRRAAPQGRLRAARLFSPPPRDDYHRLVAPGVTGWWVGGWGVGTGARGRTTVVTEWSRPPGVTPRTPPTRSASQHVGSPPITTYHHRLVTPGVTGWWGWGWVVTGARGRTAVVNDVNLNYAALDGEFRRPGPPPSPPAPPPQPHTTRPPPTTTGRRKGGSSSSFPPTCCC